MRVDAALFIGLLLITPSLASIGAGYEQVANDLLRFTKTESLYLSPYVTNRLPFPRLTLNPAIIEQMKSAPIVKY
ncbi:hypothetical protein KIN20_005418 [Parelaphostrongylus tenuis]|uniref:Uncharacterized protein n=1 Tax=Parelaphostrongylus tenuis TaxID=148309 RepID=A0AAD5QF50_PARTN|nr:hypothetical protein KIN20_005418 [Parelaphostrongylus tenuis]